jgi:peptidoglycan/xylan/chitin deacetylase (PgdA/CDA1 family)
MILDFVKRKKLSAEEKNDLAARLANHLCVDYDELLAKRILHLMNPNEVAWVSSKGIDIQLHTHRHRTPDDPALFSREIRDNRRVIKEITNRHTSHFCYPSGVCKPEFLPWLAEMGVRSATTCEPGLACSSTHALLLPRLVDSSCLLPEEFEGWLAGVSSMLPRRPLTRSG